MSSVSVGIEETGNVEQMLGRLDLAMRRKIARLAVKRGVTVVQKRAKQLCPQSIKTGSRKGWSKKTKASRSGVKPLKDTIGVVVREYDGNFLGITGPQYPAGALAHLIEFKQGKKVPKKVLWGQQTGEPREEKPFMRPAADETKSEQNAAVVNTVREGIQQAGG